ncbi:MAG TPA: hypothetical protein PLQ76_06865 [bacterium]|nr:hypothetical protein [bacterium]
MQVGSLSGNKNLFVILAILLELGAGVLYYMYYYQPTQAKITELEQIVEKKSRDVREIEMTKRLLEESIQEIQRLKVEIARIERFFPEEVFVPRVLVLIENLATATHIKINSIEPAAAGSAAPVPGAGAPVAAQPTTTAAPAAAGAAATTGPGGKPKLTFDQNKEYKTSLVNFRATGSFNNLCNFMNELTTFPKLVVVDKISVRPTTGKEDKKGSKEQDQTEVEVGETTVELDIDMPLTFYIQTQQQPELEF